jgi:hypothetical protein
MTEAEVGPSLDKVEELARAAGPVSETVWDAMVAIDFDGDALTHYYEKAIDDGHVDIARRIAAVFELMAPDEGGVESARVRASCGSSEGIAALENAAVDPDRNPYSRCSALLYLDDWAPESFARIAPEALRVALASGEVVEASNIADAIGNILLEREKAEREEESGQVIPILRH